MKWFRGYLLVTIKGYSPERFINLCSSKNILIWNLRQTEQGYEFNISVNGFRSLKPIVKKTRTRPRIVKRYGLPFLLHKYRKRKVFALGILLFCLLVYSFSLFIWDISIQGGYTHTTETLIKFLKTQNVYSGVLKENISCPTIEETLRKEFNDIGWVSAEIRGTRLIIKIVETNMPEMKEKITKPSHLVATKDGLVTSIITRTGTPKVSIGNVVKKGDILVSGIVQVIGDNETIIETKTEVADADIRMKTFYEYKDEFSLDYIYKNYTSKAKKAFSISIFNHKIILFKPLKQFEKYDILEDQRDMKVGENFYLPFKYYFTSYKEYTEEKRTYSDEEATALAQKNLDLYKEKLVEKSITILENNVTIEIKNNRCISSGKIVVEESAVKYQTIEDEEWVIPESDTESGTGVE